MADRYHMKKLLQGLTWFFMSLVALFNPLNITHGQQGCCAECAFKREDEVEQVEEEDIADIG